MLMCLVALEDPGLTVFPTHRLIRDTTSTPRRRSASAAREYFDVTPIERASCGRPTATGR